jgi:D-inositol-3-phosphate glycosyltransferase
MKKLLLVGDFACFTGFATVTENIAKHLRNKYEIDVLAINYNGDPHPLQKQFNIFPASLEGDIFGLNRIGRIVSTINYDLIFIVNDIWLIDMYLDTLAKQVEKMPPAVFYTPVDARHLKTTFIAPLNKHAKHGIFYTNFGANEAVLAGLNIPFSIIPHGVDQSVFAPVPKSVARKETGLDPSWFIVTMVDRNQPRKRLDLGIYYFAEWVKRTNKPDNVKLYYHGALKDQGIDVEDWAHYCGIDDRLIVTSRQMTMGSMLPREKLKLVYSSSDIFWKPCASEGWGLTLHEAMACGIPAVVPRSSALAEWPDGGVEYVDVIPDFPTVNPGMVNTVMDTPDLNSTIDAFDRLYFSAEYRKELGKKAYKLAIKSTFEWPNIAKRFDEVFERVLG